MGVQWIGVVEVEQLNRRMMKRVAVKKLRQQGKCQ